MATLGNLAKSSAGWLLLGHFLSRGLTMVSLVVVARILNPDEFGVVFLAAAAWGLISTVFSMYIEATVIHFQEHDLEFLDTAFWINSGMVVLLIISTILVSPLVEDYYQTPGLAHVIYVYAAGFFFTSFSQIHSAILSREMAFKTVSVINLLFQFLETALVMTLAVAGAGYWSLVLPLTIFAPVRTVVWWKVCNWRPRLVFSRDHARHIFSYSTKILGVNLIQYINVNADYLIVGKVLGQAKLGLYQFAYNAAQWPITNFVFLVSNLSFPYFSRIKEDMPTLRKQYLKMMRLISLAAFPVFIGAVMVAPEGIPLVFSEKWTPAVFVFQMLCLFGFVRAIGSPGGKLMMALGRPDLLFYFNLLQAPVLVGGILFAVRYDIYGVALASLIVLGTGGIIFIGLTLRLVDLKYSDLLRELAPSLVSVSFMAVLLAGFRHLYYTAWTSQWVFLGLALLAGAVVYLGILALGFRSTLLEGWSFGVSLARNFIESRHEKITLSPGE